MTPDGTTATTSSEPQLGATNTPQTQQTQTQPQQPPIQPPQPQPQKSKKIPILIAAVTLVLLGGGFIAWLILANRFSVTEIAANYDYADFAQTDISTTCKTAIWKSGDYDFFQGEKPKSIPVQAGKNTITITCGNDSKTFETEISMTNSQLMPEFSLPPGLADYDGDGINNETEKELGLATYTNDTDSDGLLDNVELAMGLDPKAKDDATTERQWSTYADHDQKTAVKLTAKGKGNVANTFVDTVDINPFGNTDFISSAIVKISTTSDQKPSELTLSFSGTTSYTNGNDKYAIYSLNPTTNELKEITSNDVASDNNNNGIILAAKTYDKIATVDSYDAYYFVGKKAQKPSGNATHQIGIVLDNSGSMYSCEDLRRISGKIAADCTGVNNDPNFKRVELMNSLVDQLGTKDITYSVGAFTQSYCKLQDWSTDQSQIKTAISSVNGSCQDFNGTNVQDSAKKMGDSINTKLWGSKYVIILTDGQETCGGLFNFCFGISDSTLKTYKENGIHIVTICLGVCDTAMLQRLASQTDGKYLLASDAAGLATLKDLITSNIDQSFITEDVDGNGTKDLLMADSGFRAGVDGLNFSNFVVAQRTGGSCLGISKLVRDVYIGTAKTKYTADGWADLKLTATNQTRLKKGNVYQSTNINDIYKMVATFEKETPDDYRIVENNIPVINPKYRPQFIDAGFTPSIVEKELELNGQTYSQRENAGYLDLKNATVKDEYKDDYQLFQLATMSYDVQDETSEDMSFFGAVTVLFDHQFGLGGTISPSDVKDGIAKLAAGIPLIMSMSTHGAAHAVIGESMFTDMEKDIYYIKIYDNNFPGEDRTGSFTRQVSYHGSGTSSTYVFSYDGGYLYHFVMML